MKTLIVTQDQMDQLTSLRKAVDSANEALVGAHNTKAKTVKEIREKANQEIAAFKENYETVVVPPLVAAVEFAELELSKALSETFSTGK